MKPTFFTLAALMASVGAFDITMSSSDGGYLVPIDVNGTALAEPVLVATIEGDAVIPRSLDGKKGRSLPNPTNGCTGVLASPSDFDQAHSAWYGACNGQTVPANWAYYTKTGTAVAYMCNYGGNNPCKWQEYDEAMGIVKSNCGGQGTGWVLIDSWKKGYGRSNTGQSICSWGQVITK